MAAKKKAPAKKAAPKRAASSRGRDYDPDTGRYLYGGASRVSGRAPKAENTTPVVDSLIRRGVAGMSRYTSEYPSRSAFVSAMTDAISEGELGRYPSWQWRKQAEAAIGQAWTEGRKRRRK